MLFDLFLSCLFVIGLCFIVLVIFICVVVLLFVLFVVVLFGFVCFINRVVNN